MSQDSVCRKVKNKHEKEKKEENGWLLKMGDFKRNMSCALGKRGKSTGSTIRQSRHSKKVKVATRKEVLT